jgi:hypothetical protein
MFRRNPWWKMELIPQLNNPERHGERRGKRHSWMSASRPQGTSGVLRVLAAASLCLAIPGRLHSQSTVSGLPDAPSTRLLVSRNAANPLLLQGDAQRDAQTEPQSRSPVSPQTPTPLPPCPKGPKSHVPIIFLPSTQPSCEDPLQLIVDTGRVSPLTSRQKAILATRDITDPFNLLTIGFFSAITVAANPHSAYGPGFAGWGRESGYSLAEVIQGEYTGTFLIPSLAHQDPRYHRMPGAPFSRRMEHALIHTVVSQHDDGSLMPNYATLINYPLSAVISNLYVPNTGTNLPSTTKRVLAGYATDPIGPLLAEFLPDFAKRVHIHVVFAQQILNHMATGSGQETSPF